MLRHSFLLLAFCSLPVLADSISIQTYTDTGLGNLWANGTDSAALSVAAADNSGAINAAASITTANDVWTYSGHLNGSQGGPGFSYGHPFPYSSEFEIATTMDLPESFGNVVLKGYYDVTTDGATDNSHPLQYAVNGSVYALSPTLASNQPVTLLLAHAAGTPLEIAFLSDYQMYEQGGSTDIKFALNAFDPPSDAAATPEPSSLWMLALGVVLLLLSRLPISRLLPVRS